MSIFFRRLNVTETKYVDALRYLSIRKKYHVLKLIQANTIYNSYKNILRHTAGQNDPIYISGLISMGKSLQDARISKANILWTKKRMDLVYEKFKSK